MLVSSVLCLFLQFNPMIPFTADFPGYIKDSDLGDKMHCVVFVIDGSTVDEMPD